MFIMFGSIGRKAGGRKSRAALASARGLRAPVHGAAVHRGRKAAPCVLSNRA